MSDLKIPYGWRAHVSNGFQDVIYTNGPNHIITVTVFPRLFIFTNQNWKQLEIQLCYTDNNIMGLHASVQCATDTHAPTHRCPNMVSFPVNMLDLPSVTAQCGMLCPRCYLYVTPPFSRTLTRVDPQRCRSKPPILVGDNSCRIEWPDLEP